MKHTKIAKSRAGLIIDQPFFASILLPMPITEDSNVSTFATDGESILYNEAWAETLTQAETTFVLAHETLHCVFDHFSRRGDRDPELWNVAADFVINQHLVEAKVGTMPKVGLYDPKLFQKGGGTAEGIYRLLDPKKHKGKKPGQPGAALDKITDAGTNNGTKPTDAATMAEKAANLRVRVIQAKNAAKMQGKLSAGLERLLNEALEPVVNWKEELRRFVSERAKVEYTFARPKRRFLAEDLYLPSLSGEKMGLITIAVDCSGSVSNKLLDSFGAEINAIREDVHPSAIEIIYFDSKVCHVERFEADESIVFRAKGGGGTDFEPVFENINKGAELPIACVFLTDLECDSFGDAPAYPVLWCCLERPFSPKALKVPFGEIIKVRYDE